MTYDFAAEGITVDGTGEVKALCPQCSRTRKKSNQKCLNVNTETGVWHCWHCEWSGKAKDSRARYEPPYRQQPKTYTKPPALPMGLNAPARAWLEGRGLTPEVLMRNRVTTATVFMPQVNAETNAIAFPYLRNGEAVNCKYRDREKNFRMVSGAERLLYGYDDIQETTLIVEGEIDKLSCEVAGFQNCVSVPDGAPAANTKNIDSKFDYLNDDRLQGVQTWIVAVDNDAPGKRLQDELVRRFGAERCRVVTWPEGCKDANDVLVQHGPRTLRECIEDARPVPIAGVFDAETFAGEYLQMYDDGVPKGISTGWECVDKRWRIQTGQLVVVTGIPGHGKSEWVDALCVNLAQDLGWSAAMFSPENYPVRLHLMKLAEKHIGKPYSHHGDIERMTRAEAAKALDWIQGHFHWVMPDKPNLEEIVSKAKALVMTRGIRVLVIDPWNEVEHQRPQGMTEAEYVGHGLMQLRRFARAHDVLVIVVAHPKLLEKDGKGKYPVPTPYDISGGAMWRNKADNCITVYADPTDEKGAVQIHVQKVKFKLFGQVGLVHMTWDRPTGRYHERLPT